MIPAVEKEVDKEADPEYFHYFGFGSNLLDERLHYWIKDARFVGVGVLKDYKLGFGGFANRWKGAGATIFKELGQEVWGVVWKVAHSFSETLDAQESSYHRLHVPIEMTTGETIHCRTYQMTDVSSGDHLPSPHYKHVIVSGAIEHKLPEYYVKKLRAIRHNGYTGRVFVDLEVLKTFNADDETNLNAEEKTDKIVDEALDQNILRDEPPPPKQQGLPDESAKQRS